MSPENDVFQGCVVRPAALIPFGFSKTGDVFLFRKTFLNGAFTALVTVDKDGKVDGKVIENEFNEEFTQLRSGAYRGAFVTQVREAYGEILLDIRDRCFVKEPFLSAQANRLARTIEERYGERTDHPFDDKKYKDFGVFRYTGNNKWYALVMHIRKALLESADPDITVDVLNVKIDAGKKEEILRSPGVYPAYHMNKQRWISVLLDDTLSDGQVLDLIDTSRTLVSGKKIKK